MSAMSPATTMHVAKMRKVVTIDFIALSGSVAHPAKRYPVETFSGTPWVVQSSTLDSGAGSKSVTTRNRLRRCLSGGRRTLYLCRHLAARCRLFMRGFELLQFGIQFRSHDEEQGDHVEPQHQDDHGAEGSVGLVVVGEVSEGVPEPGGGQGDAGHAHPGTGPGV